jgi:aryl-phospho-beta-D-glucosidase BglC (GH1 family)
LFLAAPAWGYYADNGSIYDDDGQQVHLYGVIWFGFETDNHVVHVLWARNWKDMITQIKGLGFTAVRAPFCPQTLNNTNVMSINYAINPYHQGLGSLDILDKVVDELDNQGLYIVFDFHTYDCQSINELWCSNTYSEQYLLGDLVFIDERYKGLKHFVGIDIEHEPHGAATWERVTNLLTGILLSRRPPTICCLLTAKSSYSFRGFRTIPYAAAPRATGGAEISNRLIFIRSISPPISLF